MADENTPAEPEAEVPQDQEIPEDAIVEGDEEAQAAGELAGGETAEAPPDEAKPEPPKPIKLDINGREVEKSLEDVVKAAQRHLNGEDKYEQAKQLKDAAEFVLGRMEKEPVDTLVDFFTVRMGNNQPAAYEAVLKSCQAFLDRERQFQELPEGDRKAILAEDKARRLEEENRQFRSERERQQAESRQAMEMQEAHRLMLPALKAVGLPEDEDGVSGVAETIVKLRAAGEDPSLQDAVEEYLYSLNERRYRDLETLPPSEVRKKAPKLATAIASEERASNIERAKLLRQQNKPRTSPSPSTASKKSTVISSADFLEAIRARR